MPFLGAVAVGFALLLFLVAAWVERRRAAVVNHPLRQTAYAMSLAVYCTSWTFFGAVGSAARSGWAYVPIYLGPILVFALMPAFLKRLVQAVQMEGATSISDFIGSRFGKSRGVAALVTLTAALGVIPYIALQLRSVGTTFASLSGGSMPAVMTVTAVLLGLFAMLFGTRRYEAAGRNEGLVVATALESLVKLAALAAIAVGALWMLGRADAGMLEQSRAQLLRSFAPSAITAEIPVITLLAMAAVLCLPRQFYMTVIEAPSPDAVDSARRPFIAYLAAMTVMVLPITWAGLALLPGDSSPDLFVLQLPVAMRNTPLVLAAFLGGFSAATAMVIVETVALATMLSNDLFAPLLLRSPRFSNEANLGRMILRLRRASIGLVVIVALGWALSLSVDRGLASIGYIAFSAMALIAPLLILAVEGRVRNAAAARAGLLAGLLLWLYTLALPPVLPPEWLAGLKGTIIDPQSLFGTGGQSPLVHGVLWSLGTDILILGLVTLRSAPARPRFFAREGVARVEDRAALAAFVSRFVGEQRVARELGPAAAGEMISRNDAHRAERLIAGVVGAPSARALMGSALAGERLGHEDIARMLDQSGQSLQFSRGLLAATLEHIDPGVSVVDGEQRLIAWNSRYLELFNYPDGMVYVGTPVADLIRYNAERGECGPGEVEAHVERRLGHLRRGEPHSFERVHDDGRVLKTVGGPMPGGGYVMCFTDITAEARARTELERARAELELRVAERTAELLRLNEELALATRDKTRFLAVASHDLLQPLHAARLFAAAAKRGAGNQPLIDRVEQSVAAAEQLLRALLDISKLDAGGVEASPEPVAIRPFLVDLAEGFRPLAVEKGLRLRVGAGTGTVMADPVLLRSALQNFLSNAIRYTLEGGVVIGARRRGDGIVIEVYDTGVGIPANKFDAIFREFERLGTSGEAGVGLGLAIVERTARLMGARVTVRSREGVGSVFGLFLPRTAAVPAPAGAPAAQALSPDPLDILVVDDDAAILDASRALLESLGHSVRTAGDAETAQGMVGGVALALVDLDLGGGMDGLDLIAALRRLRPGLKAALVTADGSPSTTLRAQAAGVPVMLKPVSPPAIEAWIATAAATAEPPSMAEA